MSRVLIKVTIAALLLTAWLPAAQTTVQSRSCNTAAVPSTTLTCTFTSSITAGNLIATLANVYNFNETITAVTTDGTNTYTIADTANQGTAPHVKVVGSYAKNVAAGSTTITITVSTSTYINVSIYEISGSDTAAPLDQHCNASPLTSQASPYPACAVTTTTADEFILAQVASDTSSTYATSGSYTLAEHLNITATNVLTFGDVTRIVSSTSTYTPEVAGSVNLSSGDSAVVMTFKAASVATFVANPTVIVVGP